jgi:hypothetical protein
MAGALPDHGENYLAPARRTPARISAIPPRALLAAPNRAKFLLSRFALFAFHLLA